ncbi:MAG TPA: winged helix-turn-helix domain-containing protein [Candidatus Lokiarchaeia archaeon]|nr:winged helix-turn-helix domain-containing protein [Candidatus Lokiarchaeia archaeon]
MKPIEITRVDYTADEMWTFYKKERDGRMKERYHAIALMLEGNNAREAADALHLSRNTTWEWAIAYDEEGLEGLKRESPPGRTPRLSKEEKDLLKADLLINPRELGYDFSIWDGKSISHHIDRRFNRHLSVRGVQQMVKKMGFTLQRANVKYVKADPVAQEKFKAELKKK